MPGRVEFELAFGKGAPGRPGGSGPMRILVMGDFSGRGAADHAKPGEQLADIPIYPIDIDNFEELLRRLAPELRLTLDAPTATELVIELRELESFHPDALYARLKVFRQLKELRHRLLDPTTFPAAAEEVRSIAPLQQTAPVEPRADQPPPPETAAGESDAATLERLLGAAPTQGAVVSPEGHRTGIDQLIRGIVSPHVTPDVEPYQDLYVQGVDQAAAALMRGILHHPSFQALEAAWRSLHGLVSGLETGEDLKLYLLDVSKEALLADMRGAGDSLQGSELYRRVVEREVDVPGGEPWALLVGDYKLGASLDDIHLLTMLGGVSNQAGGAFLAQADLSLLGCDAVTDLADPHAWASLEDTAALAWQALRGSGVAPWIGLSLPRVLVRQPYGRGSDEIDSFPFEEVAAGEDHEAFLWGNPAFSCARLVAMAFQERGWSMEPGDLLELDSLPSYTYTEGGESLLLPCAEVYMSEQAGDAILARGPMPVLSYRNRNAVRIARFQSIADPPAPLSGPWT